MVPQQALPVAPVVPVVLTRVRLGVLVLIPMVVMAALIQAAVAEVLRGLQIMVVPAGQV